jgi:hypothetical protein
MEVIAQACDVVAVRVAQQEGIYTKATLVAPFEPASQVFRDVRRVVVVIVRPAADVNVDEDVLTVIEAHQHHISIGNREECD